MATKKRTLFFQMNRPGNVLSRYFFERDDVVQISRELLGKVIQTRVDGAVTSAIITETEAYCGRNDKACHADGGLRTERTEIMYGPGGFAYVYLCYGIHHLFNVVTNRSGLADAVLVRAVKPMSGTEFMLKRRGHTELTRALANGPGKLTVALGIDRVHNGLDLRGDLIRIEDHNIDLDSSSIRSGPRVGVDYAGEDALRPWRFYLDRNWAPRQVGAPAQG